MRSRISCFLFTVVGVVMLLQPTAFAQSEDELPQQDPPQRLDAREAGEAWFSRMQEALRTLNFSAKFVAIDPFGMQMYRWLHSVNAENGEVEVLEQLDGPPQPIIRVNNRLSYFQSVGDSYSTEGSHIIGPWPEGIHTPVSRLSSSYDIVLAGGVRVLDTQAIHVRLLPKDAERYNYSFYIDRNTGMLLGAKTFAPQGELLSQVLLSHFEYQQHPIEDLERSVSEVQMPRMLSTGRESDSTQSWVVEGKPIGFQLVRQQMVELSPFTSLADHMLFSDGMTQFSVYVNSGEERPAPVRVQSLYSVVSVDKGPFTVTVVGKIPIPLAERVARSVERVNGQ
ncbi:MucB/RseB C-terminal domain-containing protein [Aliidiomarina sp. B3213]|nr:MucB/RseB C-terminal domain-containing protein [Aliidiomarina sp. B3213]RTE87105.1 hypothetical protein DQX04_01555 [Aliidiomarina sp. B3213]